MAEVKERVINLEKTLEVFVKTTQEAISSLSLEMKEFKAEMREFRQEMKESRKRSEFEMNEFKDEMQKSRKRSEFEMNEIKDEMQESRKRSELEMNEFKDEMQKFNRRREQEMQEYNKRREQEMQQFKEEMRQDKKELNKKWGELSNKLGSLAEDIAAPGLQGVIQRHFNKEPDRRMDTMWIRNVKDKNDIREFDVIAVTEEYFFVAEIKYTPRNEYVKDFVKLVTTGKVYEYWPEYQDKILVPVFSSLSLPANVVKYLTKHNVLAMAMGEDHMEIVNPKVLKTWL